MPRDVYKRQLHTITLKMDGFKDVRRKIEVSDGGTVTIYESLKRQ